VIKKANQMILNPRGVFPASCGNKQKNKLMSRYLHRGGSFQAVKRRLQSWFIILLIIVFQVLKKSQESKAASLPDKKDKTELICASTGLAVKITITEPTCAGNRDGVANVDINGGHEFVDFHWSNGASTEDISGLSAGIYSLIITDRRGCLISTEVEVGQPEVMQVAGMVSNTSCNGTEDGKIELIMRGGTAPFTYQWSDGTNRPEAAGLKPGSYEVFVSDVYGCTTKGNFSVAEPQPLSVQFSVNDVTCKGTSTGKIDISVQGGTGLYNYLWSTGDNLEDLSGLAAGIYTLTVSDENACIINNAFIIEEAELLISESQVTPSGCTGNNGTADITVNGGLPPYIVVWDDGVESFNRTSLSPGNYLARITDANLCTIEKLIVIPQTSAQLRLSFNSVSSSGSDGSIDLSIEGGTPPFSFLWSDGSQAEDLLLSSAGTYSVKVTDALGCTGEGTATIENDQNIIDPGAVMSFEVEKSSGNLLINNISNENEAGMARITFQSQIKDTYRAELADNSGNIISDLFDVSMEQGDELTFPVETSNLENGIYEVRIFSKSEQTSVKINVIR
jgi:hypothetical protein